MNTCGSRSYPGRGSSTGRNSPSRKARLRGSHSRSTMGQTTTGSLSPGPPSPITIRFSSRHGVLPPTLISTPGLTMSC